MDMKNNFLHSNNKKIDLSSHSATVDQCVDVIKDNPDLYEFIATSHHNLKEQCGYFTNVVARFIKSRNKTKTRNYAQLDQVVEHL